MPGSDLIQSLATGLDVLVLLTEAGDGLRVKDVAEKAGISSPVAHNVLRTLSAKGFVARDATAPLYRLGPRLAELCGRRDNQASLQRVEGAMFSLLEALPDATVTFSKAVNGEITVVRRLSAQSFGTVQKPSGSSLGLYSSASGLAVLAFCSEECYLTLQQHHPFLEEGTGMWSPPGTFERCLDKVRRQGYAVHPHVDDHRLVVACPVFDSRGQLAGVLGIARSAAKARPFESSELNRTAESLQAAARKASAVAPESRMRSRKDHDQH